MNDPACICPPTTRRIPHGGTCPRYDAYDRAWSIADRLERSWRDSMERMQHDETEREEQK